MANYYNDNDKTAASWLRELIKKGLIPDGDVDERSITDIEPHDLDGFTQCHFFAGIGGWSEALRLAGWPADRPVWTGSCPCQPLSVAGLGKGHEDERHLWPEFCRLILESSPTVVFGEQVASADGREWFAGIRLDLEEMGYAVGASDLCAAGVGAPHIRQRLWWVADAKSREQWRSRERAAREGSDKLQDRRHCLRRGGVADLHSNGRDKGRQGITAAGDDGAIGNRPYDRMENAERNGRRTWRDDNGEHDRRESATTSPWECYELVYCLDEKYRRVEPSSPPLVDGFPGRVGLLRGYGNAINPWVAAEFIKAAQPQ